MPRSLDPTVAAGPPSAPGSDATLVNDLHAQLNATQVYRVVRPTSVAAIAAAIRDARAEHLAVSICGGRHAMGGQQFGAGTVLLDMTGMDRVLAFDAERGEIEVEAGIQWPTLVDYLIEEQRGRERQWGIRQKQTGADRLSLGGALAANVHGRGLTFKPIIDDVLSFTLVDAEGDVLTCDREQNAELFRLVIGGYGLFGVVASVRLRLAPRTKLRREVEILDVEHLMPACERRIADGLLYGDFQFAIDPNGDDFLRGGVFSCYRPVPANTPIPGEQRALSNEDWSGLLYLGHFDKRQAVDAYTAHYLATDGQVYWSDLHQLAEYLDNYHAEVDRRTGAAVPGSEMITELYVPRAALPAFMADARADFRANNVNVVYGTIRLIERDDESFLPWAREPYACVIFNLHVDHTPAGVAQAAASFRRLIDLARQRGGSYYLTYHRFASREQVEACYPGFRDFLATKLAHDPEERFQSEWYRHHRAMFASS